MWDADTHPSRKAGENKTHPVSPPAMWSYIPAPACAGPFAVTLCFVWASWQTQPGSALTHLELFAAPRWDSKNNNSNLLWHGDGLRQIHLYSRSRRGKNRSHHHTAAGETSTPPLNSSTSHLGHREGAVENVPLFPSTSPASLPRRGGRRLPGWGLFMCRLGQWFGRRGDKQPCLPLRFSQVLLLQGAGLTTPSSAVPEDR